MVTRQWFGVYVARVTKNRAADLWVTCQVPQVLGTAETQWAAPMGFNSFWEDNNCPTDTGSPPLLAWSGDGSGPGPNPGSIVLVMFVGGDVNTPVYSLCSQKLR